MKTKAIADNAAALEAACQLQVTKGLVLWMKRKDHAERAIKCTKYTKRTLKLISSCFNTTECRARGPRRRARRCGVWLAATIRT